MILLIFVAFVIVFSIGLFVGLEAPIKEPTSYDRVKEFHEVFGHPISNKPSLNFARAGLRLDLIDEEFKELKQAVASNDLIGIADALGDLDYVVNGAAIEYGIDLPKVTAEIHRSNMTKLGPDGYPIYREDGKVLKGEDYEPPQLAKVLGV